MKHTLPKYIHHAGYGKTLLAYLIDAACTIAAIFGVYYALGNTAILKAENYQATYDEYVSYMVDSGLVADDSGTLLSYDTLLDDGTPSYLKYEQAVLTYYKVFIPNNYPNAVFSADDGVALNESKTGYDSASLAEFVLKKVYGLNKDGTAIDSSSTQYFELDASTDDPYDTKPTKDYDYTAITDQTSRNLKLAELKAHFATKDSSSKNTGVYFDAVNHFSSQAYYSSLQSAVGLKRYVAYLPSFILAPVIFFFIIPLFTPNGKTLGKLLCKTSVIGEDGYKAKKLNIALHYACVTIIWECLLIPSTILGIMAMFFLMLIDYMILILSRTHQSLHDKIARTIVIDAKQSPCFKDKEEEEAYIAANPSSNVAGFREEEKQKEDAEAKRENARILSEETILDFSTIGKARREAATITSFDEFESRQSQSLDLSDISQGKNGPLEGEKKED